MKILWVLDGHTPRLTDSMYEWDQCLLDGPARTVGQEKVENIFVSTVFLGVDHSFNEGVPMLFETMLFSDGDLDTTSWRWPTWETAEAGHKAVVHAIKNHLRLPG